MVKRRDRKKGEKKAARKRELRKSRVAKTNTNTNTTNAEKLKPKFGELPNQFVMDAIADSLHAAVNNVFDELEREGADTGPATQNSKMMGRCLYYAAAGQFVASVILGRDYCVQVGSLGVTTGGENMVKIDAANGGVAARRFHMWLGADDGGLVEYVDFTSRFFQEWTLAAGATWEREDLPSYVWGIQKDIRERHGIYYQIEIDEEPEADKQINANKAVIDRIVEQAIKIAKKKLLG